MKRLYSLLFVVIIFVVLYLMNIFTPESLQDDFIYKFVRGKNDVVELCHPISSISDVFVSQYNHYFYHSGRYVPHFLLQLFDGIFGKDLFNLINALVFCILIYYISIIASNKFTLFNSSLSFALIFFFVPSFKETTLWFTGSFNYLWSMVFTLAFLFLLKIYRRNSIKWWHWPLGFLCLFLGWTNEAVVIPVGIVIGVYLLFHIHNLYDKAVFPLIIFYMFGVALTVFSPAVLNNLGQQGEGNSSVSLIHRFVTVGVVFTQIRIFWIFILSLFIIKYWKKEVYTKFLKTSWMYVLIVICCIWVFFISNCHYARVRYAIEIYSLLALVVLINHLSLSRIVHRIVYSIGVIALFFSCFIIYYSFINYQNYLDCKQQLLLENNSLILTGTETIPQWTDSYIMRHVDFCKPDVWYNPCDKNAAVAATYGKKDVSYFPKKLYDDIVLNPMKYKEFGTVENCGLYAKQVADPNCIYHVRYLLSPYKFDKLPLVYRIIAKHINRYSSRVSEPRNTAIIHIKNHYYLVIEKPILIEERERVNHIEFI